MPKQTITQLGEKLVALNEKYSPLAIVLDFGGLGKKIAEELSSRFGLGIEAAEKERKLEHIELLNDAMRTGLFHAKKDSRFAQDCLLVEWDKSNPEKPKISDRFHSDACDMVLYGYRRAMHWLAEAAPEELGTEDAMEKELMDRMESEKSARRMDQMQSNPQNWEAEWR